MLGRQQIAGIPTAVSEVFKNAYDAYATRVKGDFFPDRRVLVIRDNGVGMSQQDFETRWLTIGTDSKARGSALPSIERPAGIAIRRQMGEKGIGRLAIATLAPQLLVVTRAQSALGGADDHLTVSLVQWSLFEAPGLTLDDVNVPIRRVGSFDEVDPELIKGMRDEFTQNLDALHGRISSELVSRILQELEGLELDVRRYLRLNGPRLEAGAGTAFVLSSVYEDLDAAMATAESKRNIYSVSEFQRFLLGFTNTINPGVKTPDYETEFILHQSTGPVDLIDPASYFWEADDFGKTDHSIEGEFDEFGTFRGELRIYGREPVEVVERWMSGAGEQSGCGPFKIKFGYVQGQASDSRLTPEDFTEMTARLEKIGGLYVYRDGIRVLPFGNSDYDYLEIEQRRSLNAATYFFSYRRMFGAIEIDSENNPELQEKAGREGFRENRAYRDFKDILKKFLIALAADYFSTKSEQSEEWKLERDRLKQRAAARKERSRKEKQQRDEFSRSLFVAIEYIESGRFGKDLSEVVKSVQRDVDRAVRDEMFEEVTLVEARASSELGKFDRAARVSRPLDLPLGRDQDREFQSFQRLREYADEQTHHAVREIQSIIDLAQARPGGRESSSLRLRRVEEARGAQVDRLNDLVERVKEQARELNDRLTEAAAQFGQSFASDAAESIDQAQELKLLDEIELVQAFREKADGHAASLDSLLQITESLDELSRVVLENTQLKEEVLDLQEQLDSNLELLQLGQAVQIVSHEFEASINTVRRGLQELAPWARSTPRLAPIVRDVRASFAHLDGYLRLFTPLQRRLYREKVVIHGAEIESFVRGVFDERLRRHDIDLVATESFGNWSFSGYPSTFYPAFVNLVDNAIHWVSAESSKPALVTLDSDGFGSSIRDSGPGVRPRDRDAIFERGFSRRRGGRGLGLSLARDLLERDGWAIELGVSSPGAEFILTPPEVSR